MSIKKIRVSLDVTVDTESWTLVYGDDPETNTEWAEEVRAHVLNDIACSSAAEAGAITSVTVTNKA